MQIAEPKKPKHKRHPLWNKETFKEELENSNLTLTGICKKYSPDNFRALWGDVTRWRREDPQLEQMTQDHIARTDSKKRSVIRGGRPRKDAEPEHADWRVKYCEILLRDKSRVKASAPTNPDCPYDYNTIQKMLNPAYKEFDKHFADLVHETEQHLVAWAEERLWWSLDNETQPRHIAWIAKEILKVRDRDRWGDRIGLDVQHRGLLKFQVNRERVLAELAEEQVQALPGAKSALQLNSGNDVIDVDVVTSEGGSDNESL